MPETKRRFNRVLLKLSGEAIAKKDAAGGVDEIFDPQIIDEITDVIARLVADGIQIGIVIGAGNIWRGAYGKGVQIVCDRLRAAGMNDVCIRLYPGCRHEVHNERPAARAQCYADLRSWLDVHCG